LVQTTRPKGIPFGVSAKGGRRSQTSITFATGFLYWPTTRQLDPWDDEHISSVPNFSNSALNDLVSINCTTHGRLAWRIGGSGSLGNESSFPQAFSRAKLLITIVDGPCKISVTSGTVAPDGKTKGYPLWVSAKGGRCSQTSITFATGVHYRPTTSQLEPWDDEHISSVLNFSTSALNDLVSINCMTYGRLAWRMGGSGSLENESGFPQAFLGAKLLITIVDGPYKFSVTSETVGPDGQTKGYPLWGFGK